MSNIYEKLGVPTIINAKGPATRLSGGVMAEEVSKAMQEATQYCIDMTELQTRASGIISEITGAEAGCVTSGAAAGLLQGTAACVAGLDPAKMNRLPDTSGMRNEVIVVRSQRNFYDHAVRTVGVKMVEVGLPDRYSGAGVRDAEAWEIADAINENTACVFYVANSRSRPALHDVTEVAHTSDIPVLVDAAAQIPPVENLRRFIREGADLVAFSGGKAIRGPQGSGILCGRRDLVVSAALQNLDHDIFFDQWQPPPGLFDKSVLRGLPQHGIGRACKVGKEQVVGLLIALRLFAGGSSEKQNIRNLKLLENLFGKLNPKFQSLAEIVMTPGSEEPVLHLRTGKDDPDSAFALMLRLERGEPGIHCDPSRTDEGLVIISASCLKPEDTESIAARLNELLADDSSI
ncbi:MAG: aminotransferase class V-fold PLP-dependent enzyme [SAR324 cluster bacterium]|jgi:L-seryl-tRNA(Ser) seleniumtransferase|nr:aminotransferase class V-fold PLP-dependent enzyme [SAR324 cluster bacterium]